MNAAQLTSALWERSGVKKASEFLELMHAECKGPNKDRAAVAWAYTSALMAHPKDRAQYVQLTMQAWNDLIS